jgi:hypothetical protein
MIIRRAPQARTAALLQISPGDPAKAPPLHGVGPSSRTVPLVPGRAKLGHFLSSRLGSNTYYGMMLSLRHKSSSGMLFRLANGHGKKIDIGPRSRMHTENTRGKYLPPRRDKRGARVLRSKTRGELLETRVSGQARLHPISTAANAFRSMLDRGR